MNQADTDADTTPNEGGKLSSQFRVANAHLDDPLRLDALLREDGYLFFRNVIPRVAIEDTKRQMLSVLKQEGWVGPEEQLPVWSGKPFTRNRAGTADVALRKTFETMHLWEQLIETPEIHQFFEQVAGEPVEFLPIAEYRVRPPGEDLVFWHQDGYFEQGFGLLTAWIPLMEIDESLGGLEIASGMHKEGYLHVPRSLDGIPADAIPFNTRRKSHFDPGDVLIFSEMTPHNGLPNMSPLRLFRISVDVRFRKVSQPALAFGSLAEIGPDFVRIASTDGKTATLRVAADTLLRAPTEILDGTQLGEWTIGIGTQVVAAQHDGSVVFIRPVKVS